MFIGKSQHVIVSSLGSFPSRHKPILLREEQRRFVMRQAVGHRTALPVCSVTSRCAASPVPAPKTHPALNCILLFVLLRGARTLAFLLSTLARQIVANSIYHDQGPTPTLHQGVLSPGASQLHGIALLSPSRQKGPYPGGAEEMDTRLESWSYEPVVVYIYRVEPHLNIKKWRRHSQRSRRRPPATTSHASLTHQSNLYQAVHYSR